MLQLRQNFQNLSKGSEIKTHIKLPHIDAIGSYQFLTFRTNESIDKYIKKLLSTQNIKTSLQQYEIDKHLDSSKNGSYFYGDVLEYLYHFLKEQDKSLYELVSFVVMPNHVHILFKQIKPISEVVRVLKAKSAINLNRLLGKTGKFWAGEYFDKVIRDEKHFEKVYKYIYENPLKVELSLDFRYYSVYESQISASKRAKMNHRFP